MFFFFFSFLFSFKLPSTRKVFLYISTVYGRKHIVIQSTGQDKIIVLAGKKTVKQTPAAQRHVKDTAQMSKATVNHLKSCILKE